MQALQGFFFSHKQCSIARSGTIFVATSSFSFSSVLELMLGHLVKSGTTSILLSDLQPTAYSRAIEMYKVCHAINYKNKITVG